ncbi:hypothetical protein [Azospirillum argentinense]
MTSQETHSVLNSAREKQARAPETRNVTLCGMKNLLR